MPDVSSVLESMRRLEDAAGGSIDRSNTSAVVDPSPASERDVDHSSEGTCHCGPQSCYGFDKKDPLTWIGSPIVTVV